MKSNISAVGLVFSLGVFCLVDLSLLPDDPDFTGLSETFVFNAVLIVLLALSKALP